MILVEARTAKHTFRINRLDNGHYAVEKWVPNEYWKTLTTYEDISHVLHEFYEQIQTDIEKAGGF